MERVLQSVVAAAFLLLSVAYGIGSLLLPMGTLERPGPGFFPLIVALVMAALSSPLLWRFLCVKKPQPPGEHPFPRGPDLRRVLAMGGSLILFAVLLQPLGYGISSALLMGAVLRLLGMRHWGRIALSAVLTTAISYWLFAILLDVPLPTGVFF
jgi:putative tricarboxylic transport membrane protein